MGSMEVNELKLSPDATGVLLAGLGADEGTWREQKADFHCSAQHPFQLWLVFQLWPLSKEQDLGY